MMLVTGFTGRKKGVSSLHIHVGGGRDKASITVDENRSNGCEKWPIQNVTSEFTFIKPTRRDFKLIKLYK